MVVTQLAYIRIVCVREVSPMPTYFNFAIYCLGQKPASNLTAD